MKDEESLSTKTTIFWSTLRSHISGKIFGAIGVQSDLDRNLNCMPKMLTDTFAAPSYIMVFDSNYTVHQHWENHKEVAVDGYNQLVISNRLLLEKTISDKSIQFPYIGHFYCKVNGRLKVRITALKFDAPAGTHTYYISTGQNEELQGALEARFVKLMSRDLIYEYDITGAVYLILYVVFLLGLECFV